MSDVSFDHLVDDDLRVYLTGPSNAGSYQQLCDFVRYTQSAWWEDNYLAGQLSCSDDVDDTLLDARARHISNASNALEVGEFEQVHHYLRRYWSI